MIDHPRVRDGRSCPMCAGSKAVGLVVCWGCWRLYRVRDGNRVVEATLDEYEARLRGESYHAAPHQTA